MLARLSRQWEWRYLVVAFLAVLLSGCGGAARMGSLFSDSEPSNQSQPESGSKVALLLPLSAPGETRKIAVALRQAAEMALTDTGGGISFIVKDTGGSPDGAKAAADAALNEGAQLILGPLLAEEVRAVAPAAQGRGINVIAFSSASAVAGNGTFLMSFLPEEEIASVLRFATSKGYRTIAALYPASQYGAAVERALVQAAGQYGASIVAQQRYARVEDSIAESAAQVAPALKGQGTALLLPESGDILGKIGVALSDNGITPASVKILGTGQWDDAATRNAAIAMGGWYAGVAPDLVVRFDQKYADLHGAKPPRLASLAYDAATLAVNLAKRGDFSTAAIAGPQGYQGANGLFRFRDNGLIERGLAILQMGPGGPDVIAPAPTAF
jgi:ABC-type branched-subunit amino acid transport system substrate-binding protein